MQLPLPQYCCIQYSLSWKSKQQKQKLHPSRFQRWIVKMSKDCTTALIVHLIIQYSFTVKYLGAEKFSFSSWSNLQKFLHSDWTELYRLSRPWLVSKTFPKFLSKAKLLITLFSPSLPVHKKRMPRASPLQERLLLTMTHFCSTLPKFGKSSTLGRAYWTKGTWGGDGDFNMRANLFYWDNALSIPFYRAGVYWIYILSIHPGCLRGNFQYTPALEKRMAIHCLESRWIGKYAPRGNLLPSVLEIASGGVFSNIPLISAVYITGLSSKW